MKPSPTHITKLSITYKSLLVLLCDPFILLPLPPGSDVFAFLPHKD